MGPRAILEKHQVWLYLAGILAGMGLGWTWPMAGTSLDAWLWPVLGVLLYATFTQVPLTHLATAFRDARFVAALVTGNFVVMPAVVWVLTLFAPPDPAIRLGILLVLLVPCTDWFISFTHLGQGDSARAISASPILLLLQIALLPVYLWLFMGREMAGADLAAHLLPAFAGLILVPLLLAWLTEQAAGRLAGARAWVRAMGWLPVPALTVVVFLIAASQIRLVADTGSLLGPLAIVFVLYLVAAALVGALLTWAFRLPAPQGRTLAFSFGTRNSFVVLPFALALPEPWTPAVVVIVFQSLVELFGMTAYLKWLPRLFVHKKRRWG